jgi:hypothetical protein
MSGRRIDDPAELARAASIFRRALERAEGLARGDHSVEENRRVTIRQGRRPVNVAVDGFVQRGLEEPAS